MPTNIFGVALYIFALFPGIIFTFSRERHKPSVKRTAFRETTTVLLVSAVCDGAVFLVVVGLSFAIPGISRVGLSFFAPWNQLDPFGVLWLVVLAVGSLAATLALGWFLGSAAMDGTALGKFLQSNTTLVGPERLRLGLLVHSRPRQQSLERPYSGWATAQERDLDTGLPAPI